MKIKSVITLFIATFLLASCAEKHNLSIEGTAVNVTEGKVYLQKFNNKMYDVIDSVDIVDGKFSFVGSVEIPEIYGLTFDPSRSSYMLFLDGSPVTVELNSESGYRNTVVTGSALHDSFIAYQELRDVKIDEYIKENPKSLVAAYVLYRNFSYRLSPEEITANIKALDPSLHNTPYVKVLQDLVRTLESVAIGKTAPDFTMADVNGNDVSLSQLYGKSYVFLDFWASWCPPCRREKPNLVAAFNKYKSEGFTVFGVSLDHDKEAWLAAIESDGLAWTHVSDLQHWNNSAAALYGIRAIPASLLLDSEGTIVAKNLHGEALHEKLKELYGK
jgi:Peroxiredoxin